MKWQKASHLNGFGNFLFSKFFGKSIDEITDGRGFEPLLFHFQGIFAVSALFQRAAAVTWEWDFDRQGVHAGHYFMEN